MRIKLEATWEREMLGKNLQSPSLSGLFSCFLEKILYNQVQHDIITLSVRLIKKILASIVGVWSQKNGNYESKKISFCRDSSSGR